MKEVNGVKTISRFGIFIRKTKIDELPLLFNVLIGNMSVVGPRHDVPGYYDKLQGEERKILEVKPGITGWAQVNGRNAISWNQKFDYDVWYVDNLSFLVDLKILFLTIKKVVASEGISSEGKAITEYFKGNV